MMPMLRILQAMMLLGALAWSASAQAEFKKAIAHKPPTGCPNGSFWDPRNGGECWSCGSRSRSIWPVTSDKACFTPAREELSRATRGSDLGCSSGSVDLGKNVCWSCPSDYNRSVFAVDTNKACHVPSSETLKSAKHLRDNTSVGQGCPKGWFWDSKQYSSHSLPRSAMGACWDCSDGYSRTGHSVAGKKACSKSNAEKWSAANLHGAPKNSCSGPEFRHGLTSQCWSCPSGYNRTANAIDGTSACSKAIPESSAAAEFKSKFAILNACGGAGRFYDLATAKCWSCPTGYFRSVNPVTGEKACTNQPLEIFAADVPGMCTAVIDAMKGGSDGMDKLAELLKPLLNTVRAPLSQAFTSITSRVNSPAELEQIMTDVSSRAGSSLGKVAGFEGKLSAVRDLLLDSGTMCQGNFAAVERRLDRAGVAFSPSDRTYLAISATGAFVDAQTHVGYSVSFSFVTNFKTGRGLYISMGPQASTAVGASLSVGAMIFPSLTLADFGPSTVPGLGVSLGAGDKIQAFFKKAGSASRAFPNSIDLSFDPTFQTIPGIGVSKGFGGEGSKVLDVTGSSTWSFPLQKWGN